MSNTLLDLLRSNTRSTAFRRWQLALSEGLGAPTLLPLLRAAAGEISLSSPLGRWCLVASEAASNPARQPELLGLLRAATQPHTGDDYQWKLLVSIGSGAAPPAVPVLVDPLDGQSFFLGSVQPLSSTTTDLDLDRIDFVLKTGSSETVIGSVSSAPYDTTWVVAGSLGFHQVIARAWRSGAHTDSLVATIDLLPVYLLTAPANGFAAFIGEAVGLGASTTEVVTRVDWVLDPGTPGETIIATDNTSPFTGSWSPTFLDVGTHTMAARFVTGITHVDSAPITVFVIQATLRNDTHFQDTVWAGPPKFYIDSNLGQVYARAWGAGGGGTVGVGSGDGGWYAGGQVTPGATETVIEMSRGATSLAVNWAPSGGNAWTQFLASYAVMRTNFGATPTYIAGALWIQGESDAGVQAQADAYQANLAAFKAAVFAALGVTFPFLVVRLSNLTTFTYKNTVRAAQETQNFLDIDNLALQGDDTHYTSATELEVGKRAAAVLGP